MVNITNKKILASALILIIAATSIFLFLNQPAPTQTPQPQPTSNHSNVESTQFNVTIHAWVKQYRAGKLVSETYHPMSLTDNGKDWIADKLFNSGGTNVTQYAMYIGCSANTSTFDAAWTALPQEISGSGLDRALATWADTGTGTGTLSKTFTANATVSTQLYGLYSDTYANAPTSTLVAAEQQGAGAVKNLISGDTLAITVSVTVS